jgi:hypothetical protein
MRFKSVVLVGMLCLFAGVASAEITRISPSVVPYVSSNSSITIFGSNLVGTELTTVVFDGIYEVEASGSSTQLVVSVPIDVTVFTGDHTLEVHSYDTAGTRIHGPVTFTVEAQPGSGPPILGLPETVMAEADSDRGAIVEYEATAVSAVTGDPVAVTCAPASGSRFLLGATSVQCSATDAGGTTNGSFIVLVTDTTPPVLTVPDNIETDNPVVTFTATAVDNLDGAVPVTCTPASGSTFSTGTTTVRCAATDLHFNVVSGFFTVHVTSGPPVLIVPEHQFVEATSAAGAAVTFEIFTEEATSSACTPASGSTFPFGDTTVTCTATNSFGTTTGTFVVTVEDHSGPVLTLPSVVEAEATSPAGANVSFVVTAVDAVDGSRAFTCTPASGTFFAFGTTTVFCTSSDSRGNLSTGEFDVIVQDTTAPTFTTATANPSALWPPNHHMVPITLTVAATDAVDPAPVVEILSVSSSQPIDGTGDGDTSPDWVITGPLSLQLRSERSHGVDRTYTITVSATDVYGNVGTATITVVVSQSSSSLKSWRSIH